MSSRLLRTRVRVEGVRVLSAVKALTSEGVTLKNVQKIKNNCLKMTIKSKDKAKTFAILQKLCYNYSVEWDFSIKSLLSHLRKRLGAPLGLLVGAAVCWVLSTGVIAVNVSGLSRMENHTASLHAEKVLKIPSLFYKPCESEIRDAINALDYVADCWVTVKGNYVFVRATGVDRAEDKTDAAYSLSSLEDAIVTRMVVRQGRALVSVGDVVKKGQPLVSGHLQSSAGQDQILTVPVDAEIYGEVVERKTVTLPSERIERRYTGRRESFSLLTMPWQSVSVKSSFEVCDSYYYTGRLNALLPITYTKVEYREVALERIATDVEQEANRLIEAMTEQNPFEVKSARVDISEVGAGVTKISAYVIREKQIGF